MIYFIRHGETDYNKKRLFQGHLDIPLNETGLAQAQQALENSKSIRFDIIYTSPLLRAKKTAEIINQYHQAKLIADDRLKEIYMGRLQGICAQTLSEKEQELSFSTPEYFDGESLAEFYSRVTSFFKEIEHSNKNILIVAHHGIYTAIHKYLNNIEGFDFRVNKIKNAELLILKP